MNDLYRAKPYIVSARHFDWVDGEVIPDIPGVKFREWTDVEVLPGLTKPAPVVGTAYVDTPVGSLHVRRGDWIVRNVEDELLPYDPETFRWSFELIFETSELKEIAP